MDGVSRKKGFYLLHDGQETKYYLLGYKLLDPLLKTVAFTITIVSKECS